MGRICPLCGCHRLRSRVVGRRFRYACEHCDHTWYEEAPLPCPHFEPKPEGKTETKLMLLLTASDGGVFIVSDRVHLEGVAWKNSVGVYRVPRSQALWGKHTLAEALALIRDAGGEALGDSEPLPGPVVETFPILERPKEAVRCFGSEWTHSCSQCGNHFSNGDPRTCAACQSKLSGEVPWAPYPPNSPPAWMEV